MPATATTGGHRQAQAATEHGADGQQQGEADFQPEGPAGPADLVAGQVVGQVRRDQDGGPGVVGQRSADAVASRRPPGCR